MGYRQLGSSGLMVSPLGLGTMNFGRGTSEAEATEIIQAAIDVGINLIDTADVYNGGESERIIGRALRAAGRRADVLVATKVYNRMGEGPNNWNLSRAHIIEACEASLRRLDMEHIDLYQLHRSSQYVPHDETLRALDDLVTAGKVRYIGASTFPAWSVMEGLALSEKHGWARYVCEQPPYSLVDRRIENELVPLAQKYGLGILPWSPLGMGIAAGKYLPGTEAPPGSRLAEGRNKMGVRVTERGREVGARMHEMAEERGLTGSQLALLWVKDQPGVTAPIIGPRTLAHLEDAIPVMDMALADEDRPMFDELVPPGTAVADFHNTAWWMKARF